VPLRSILEELRTAVAEWEATLWITPAHSTGVTVRVGILEAFT
jgi:hypothetical protein